MKITLFFFILCLTMWFGSSLPQDDGDVFTPSRGRSLPAGMQHHGLWRQVRAPPSLESQVTKGHYICGDKICKAKPGVEHEGCNGLCQIPIL